MSGTIISYEMGGWPAPFGIELRVDAFNSLLLVLTTGASTLALLGARTSIAEIDERRAVSRCFMPPG